MSSRERTWWRNIRGGVYVELLLKGRNVIGFANLERDEDQVKLCMVGYLLHSPHAAKPLGIRVEDGKPNEEDIARAAGDGLFIKIRL